MKKVILTTIDSIYALNEEDIIYCQSDGNYTTFFTIKSKSIVVSKSLKKIQELLTEDSFIRCSQSYIINKKYIERYDKKGNYFEANNLKVPVSSRQRERALEKAFS